MLDVANAPAEIRAAAVALRRVDREVRSQISTRTRTEMNAPWRAEVERRMSHPLDRAVLGAGVRIKAGNPPAALAAQSRRMLPGGLVPNQDWPMVEFGANRGKRKRYTTRSRKGTAYVVNRRTAVQLPPRDASGRVVFAAVAEIGPRLASLWAATIIRTVYEAAEQKG